MNKTVMSAILGPYALAMLIRKKGAKNNPIDEMISSITRDPKGLVVTVNVDYMPTREMSWCDKEWDDCEDADDYDWITTEVAELPSNLETALDFFKEIVEYGRTLGEDPDISDFARETLWDYEADMVYRNMDFDNFTTEGMFIPDYIDRTMIPNEENVSTIINSEDEWKTHSITFKAIFKTDPKLMEASKAEIYTSICEIVTIAFFMTGNMWENDQYSHRIGEVQHIDVQLPKDIHLPMINNLRTNVRRF